MIFSVFFLTIFSAHSQSLTDAKYLFSFQSNKSTCLLRVNDLPAFDNTTDDDGTISAAFTMTAFLEKGNNDIELLMGPQDAGDPQSLFSDSSCQVTVTNETPGGTVLLADYRLTVNNKNEMTAVNSLNHANGAKVTEGYTTSDKDFGLYKMQSVVTPDLLPEWSWVKATPVTQKDLPKIRQAYDAIWMQIKHRDIQGLKRTAKISNEEMAKAEGTTPEMIFLSTDLPEHVNDPRLTPADIEWDKYDLMRYRGGRLFRMGVGFFQNSPLRFKNAEGKVVYTYNPYFSMINGEVVLVR
ncbi:IdsF [Yokenella regensburgei]